MSQTKQTKLIDDVEVTVVQQPAMRSYRLLARLARLLGPAFGRLEGIDLKNILDEEIAVFLPAVEKLFTSLEPDDAQALAREILATSRASVDGKFIDLGNDDGINFVFTGKVDTMLKAMKFALEVEYGDFFGKALAGARNLPASAKEESESTQTKTP